MLTYATSYNMLPAIRDLDVPVVLVNVQKRKALDYDHTDIAAWLGGATPAEQSARQWRTWNVSESATQ